MECRAYGICLDSQSRGYLGKDRKVSSAAGGNLSRMHKTQETAKESRLKFMYSHLRNRTLVPEIREPQRDAEILAPQKLNDRLQIISLFARDSDLALLSLALDLCIECFDRFDDLLGFVSFESLLNMNFLARVAQR